MTHAIGEIIYDLSEFARITFLLLDGESGAVYGYEGLIGARLITNCAYHEIHGTEMGLAGGMQLPDLVEFQDRIEELKSHNMEFVVCYHHDQSPAWHVDCSSGLTRTDGLALMISYLQDGLYIGEVA